MTYLGLHNKPKAAVHLPMGPLEEEEEEEDDDDILPILSDLLTSHIPVHSSVVMRHGALKSSETECENSIHIASYSNYSTKQVLAV
jgi:hypothetical protein